jgi:hypothetical protein
MFTDGSQTSCVSGLQPLISKSTSWLPYEIAYGDWGVAKGNHRADCGGNFVPILWIKPNILPTPAAWKVLPAQNWVLLPAWGVLTRVVLAGMEANSRFGLCICESYERRVYHRPSTRSIFCIVPNSCREMSRCCSLFARRLRSPLRCHFWTRTPMLPQKMPREQTRHRHSWR